MKTTFLGIGLGPIQTGIFLDGAFRGGFDRLVIADVDAALAARNLFGDNAGEIHDDFKSLWGAWNEEATRVWLQVQEKLA